MMVQPEYRYHSGFTCTHRKEGEHSAVLVAAAMPALREVFLEQVRHALVEGVFAGGVDVGGAGSGHLGFEGVV